MAEVSRRKIFSNMLWRFFERCGAQLVTLIVTFAIAKVLAPNLFGQVALLSVVITILQVFVDSGLGTALIQKEKSDDLDFSTVFFVNILLCIVAYGLFYLIVPFITDFYGMMDLIDPMRISGLTIIISGVKNVQQAYVTKHFLFKKFFFSTLAGTLVAGVVGIYMAYSGYGIWALVVQDLLNKTIDTVILWITVPWRPKRVFSLGRLKILISYGWKMFFSSLLNTIYTEIRQLIIGKKYSTEDLGYYDQALKYPRLVVGNVNTAIDSVLLPSMAEVQNDTERVKAMTRRAIKTSTYVIMPIMTGVAVCAEFLVRVLLSEEWLPSVPYIRIFCLTYAFFVIHTANLNAIKAVGKSDIYLRLEIIKVSLGLTILLATMWNGVMGIAIGGIINSFASQIVNAWPNKKLLNYSYLEQIKDIIPNMLLSTAMGVICFLLLYLPINPWFIFVLQVVLGATFYIFISKIFGFDSYQYCFGLVKSFKTSKNRG